jgi:hypothetical protein
MRYRFLLTAALVVAAAGPSATQSDPPLSPLELSVACAPPPTLETPSGKLLRVIGAQDVVARTEFGNGDLLMIDGGTAAGVQIGQRYFVRRANRFGTYGASSLRQGARTGGWVRIVAANESTAVASFDHVCGPVAANDYLEPFVAPVVPPGADRDEAPGEPDFNAMGQIVVGNEERNSMAVGDFALIDRGTQHGMAPGARLALYRSVGVSGMPLASVGEAIVITVSQTMALARITRAKDAIRGGDFVAPRK